MDEGEFIGLCGAAVTKKMAEVKEVPAHLPCRRFRKAWPPPRIEKFPAEAQARAQPSAPSAYLATSSDKCGTYGSIRFFNDNVP